MKDNLRFDVYSKIRDQERCNWKLYIDAIYRSNPNSKSMDGEVISKLIGVKNQGGFRYLGTKKKPALLVLYSSGNDIYWRDSLDSEKGIYTYYGDNKKPGLDLHKTSLHGNEILRSVFNLATKTGKERVSIPPIFVFRKENGRDVKFIGLAVPGAKELPQNEWLTAVWGRNKDNDRFQNYKAMFTILRIDQKENTNGNSGIDLQWITDIVDGKSLESKFAPKEWIRYIEKSEYSPLVTTKEKAILKKEEQLPKLENETRMLSTLHDYFINKDRGYSFERFACDIAKGMDASIKQLEVTRPYRDGGFDGIGKYLIYSNSFNAVEVEFYLQAKCYDVNNAVGVKDTSRLISRIKNRQFGIMITTSYIAAQAYSEIIDDGQPIALITGKSIIDYVVSNLEIYDDKVLLEYLEVNY